MILKAAMARSTTSGKPLPCSTCSIKQLFHFSNEISTKKVRNRASKWSKCLLFVETSDSFVGRYCLSTVPEVYTSGIDFRSAPEKLLSNLLSIQPVKLKESPRPPLLWSSLIRQCSAESLTVNLKGCFPPTVSGRGIFLSVCSGLIYVMFLLKGFQRAWDIITLFYFPNLKKTWISTSWKLKYLISFEIIFNHIYGRNTELLSAHKLFTNSHFPFLLWSLFERENVRLYAVPGISLTSAPLMFYPSDATNPSQIKFSFH